MTGLVPESALVLMPGFVREEWKSLCFQNGKAITQHAILSPKQIAQMLVPELQDQVLERSARVELLRENFKAPELRSALPKLMEHRFRPKFFESLDRALQKGRELFAHAEEASIFEERLNEKNGSDERRTEFFGLNRFWDRLLEVRQFHDEASLLEAAVRKLREDGALGLPFKKLYWLHHFKMNPRVEHFMQELAKQVEVESIHSSQLVDAPERMTLNLKMTHSLEDCAHHVIDRVMRDPDREIVVIEDRPEIRRTLSRVARERGLNLQDARDPTLLSHSEEVKTALLELELVARNFPRDLALAWISAKGKAAFASAREADLRRRILESNLEPAGNPLFESLVKRYPKRMALADLRGAIQESIHDFALPSWVEKVLVDQIEEWERGLLQLGSRKRAQPLRFLLKELQERLRSAPPPVPPIRFESGLRIFRVDQAVSFALKAGTRVHFFGVSPAFFEPREEGTEWLSGRDLETLAFEFGLPDRRARRETARSSMQSWLSRSNHPEGAVFWEFAHDENGTEVESAELALRSFSSFDCGARETLPVHPDVLPALTARLRPSKPLAEVPFSGTEFPMGFLNSLGDCPFTAYARHLLKVFDERDPDYEIGADVYGNLLHAAIELLMASKSELTPEAAFDEAWARTRKPAWLKSERLFRAMKSRALETLRRFLESEVEYRSRSGAELKLQEGDIELHREGIRFLGRMDRVDQHADGLVIMDYKTGSKQPSGQASLETGKGLQLASYALALRERENQEVVSARYVILSTDKINRNYGVLFKKWNQGKAADSVEFPLSFVKSNHTSLFNEEPETLWKAFDEKITGLIRTAKASGFRAEPADPQDCKSCRYSGLCGRERGVLA